MESYVELQQSLKNNGYVVEDGDVETEGYFITNAPFSELKSVPSDKMHLITINPPVWMVYKY